MSPVAADRLTCTTSVEVKIAYANTSSELRTAQQVECERRDIPGVGGRGKVLFCQLLLHTHDALGRKNLGHVEQRWRRDGVQTSCGRWSERFLASRLTDALTDLEKGPRK
jgi:hypothetical protein